MGLNNFILTCEKDNTELRKDIEYYKNYNKRLQKENQKHKEVIDKMNKLLQQEQDAMTTKFHYDIVGLINALLDILKEVE